MPEGDFEKELTELRKLIQDSTKGISHEDNWGKKDFAYSIKKQARGHYVVFTFNATPDEIAELRANVKLDQNILRHMLITIPDDYDPARYKTEMLRQEEKSESDEGGRRRPIRPKASSPVSSLRTPEKPPMVKTDSSMKPTLAGKDEEEQLKTVSKKLDEILENPDINI